MTGHAKIKKASKSAIAEPVAPVGSLHPSGLISVQPKRGRGRPRKNPLPAIPTTIAKTFEEAKLNQKIEKTFKHALAEAVLAEMPISEALFDGGGTKQDGHVIDKPGLERRVARRLNVVDRYLTDDRLFNLLAQSSLKEVGIYEGIMMDKALVLKGQPTVIIGSEDRAAMDTVLPKLLAELHRRKLTTTVSERKIEFTGTNE